MIYFVVAVIWGLVFGGFCSYLAKEKNRDGGNWFALGFFFSLIALITIAALPAKAKETPLQKITKNMKIQ